MNILVCIGHVPDTTSRVAFTNNNTEFDSNGVQYVIGPYEDFALGRAVELKDSHQAHVTVVHVGTADAEQTIRKALAIGADEAIRVDAPAPDAWFVAKQIAAVAQEGDYQIILTGRESSDYNGGMVHGMVAELLGWPSITPAMRLDIEGDKAILDREIEGGQETVEVGFPFVAGGQEPIAEWKIPNVRGIMMARKKPLNTKAPVEVEPRQSLVHYELPPPKGEVKLVDADNPQALVDLLKNEAKVF